MTVNEEFVLINPTIAAHSLDLLRQANRNWAAAERAYQHQAMHKPVRDQGADVEWDTAPVERSEPLRPRNA